MEAQEIRIVLGFSSDDQAWLRRSSIVVPKYWQGHAVAPVAGDAIRIGGRQSGAQYQFTLQADDLAELRAWEPRIRQALSQVPELVDVKTLTVSGMIAPASVPHEMITDSFHHRP